MKFDFKISSKNNAAINMGSIGQAAAKTWEKIHTMTFFALLIVSAMLGWKIWQQSLSGAGWSDQQKQDYLNTQNKGVVLNEAGFNQAIASVQARKDENNNAYTPIKEIFTPYNQNP